MENRFIGKICPYCRTPLQDGDVFVTCSVCDMPHHLSCWQENNGCTTFGCTGSIQEMFGYWEPGRAPGPASAQAARQTGPANMESQSWKEYGI